MFLVFGFGCLSGICDLFGIQIFGHVQISKFPIAPIAPQLHVTVNVSVKFQIPTNSSHPRRQTGRQPIKEMSLQPPQAQSHHVRRLSGGSLVVPQSPRVRRLSGSGPGGAPGSASSSPLLSRRSNLSSASGLTGSSDLTRLPSTFPLLSADQLLADLYNGVVLGSEQTVMSGDWGMQDDEDQDDEEEGVPDISVLSTPLTESYLEQCDPAAVAKAVVALMGLASTEKQGGSWSRVIERVGDELCTVDQEAAAVLEKQQLVQ
ncbi:hypothetical protein DFS34DRAFT_204972 [Phlyctochytrium arcticum]|nr:hypothetical protein DFS34DRAFT_204972 [Phlyctochytrium arcticum]